LPVAGLVLLIAVAWAAGMGRQLSLAAIAENRAMLKDFTAQHWFAAIAIFASAYIAIVALSVPGAAVMSILGGFLFGWWVSAPVTAISATIGGTIVFHVVKTSLGETLAERAGPTARKLQQGFAADAFNYLLFLRLVPVFPFFLVNAVAGICRVNVWTFIAATIIGIAPAAVIFAFVGQGLDGVIADRERAFNECVAAKGAANCSFDFDASHLLTPELMLALAALGVLALIPAIFKFVKARKKRP
jgi:uncharacterized membrane protein YdjX (TVP38/TMEM64 family)